MIGLLAAAALAGANAATDPRDWHTKYTGSLSDTYWVCQRAGGEGDRIYTRCAREEYQRRNGEVNAAYRHVMATRTESEAQALRLGQRRWIKHRDASCARVRQQQPGTNALHLEPQCLADETIRRTIGLEQLR